MLGTLKGFPNPPTSALRRAKPASALPLRRDLDLTGPEGRRRQPVGRGRAKRGVGGEGVVDPKAPKGSSAVGRTRRSARQHYPAAACLRGVATAASRLAAETSAWIEAVSASASCPVPWIRAVASPERSST